MFSPQNPLLAADEPLTMNQEHDPQIQTIDATAAGERLDKWLAAPTRLGSRKKAAEALERGKIFVNEAQQKIGNGGRLLVVGDRVRVWLDRPGSAKPTGLRKGGAALSALGELLVLFEDEDLIVVNKPAGLLTVPRPGGEEHDDTVVSRLEVAIDRKQRRRLFIVHRIDRWTTGLVVVARSTEAQEKLRDQFYRRTPERSYKAIANGLVTEDSGEWEDTLFADEQTRVQRRARVGEDGAEAITRFRVLERFGERATLLAANLVTGKRNQIRVQASLRGHPLVGERLYTTKRVAEPIKFPRQALHAERLCFLHPRTGAPLECIAPFPADMKKLVTRLRREARSS